MDYIIKHVLIDSITIEWLPNWFDRVFFKRRKGVVKYDQKEGCWYFSDIKDRKSYPMPPNDFFLDIVYLINNPE